MPITFYNSKNQEKSCRLDNINLHSSYNPSREAERFVSTRECSFTPSAILVTEPCLSYCASFLRQRFTNARIYAVRYSTDFKETDFLWDKVFYLEGEGSLGETLFNFFGEEKIMATLFISWTPSETAFKKEYEKTWNEIKKTVKKAQSLLVTRSYFSRRWLKNCVRFALFTERTASVNNIHSPVLICASGPSLKSSIPYIKQFRNRFALICVSSALSVLIENGITPDLLISTDGGYWAKLHMSFHLSGLEDLPVLLSPESGAFSSELEAFPIVPLFYGDGLSESFSPLFATKEKGERNGTVSGTAAVFALSMTDNKVFFCGLDLSSAKGFVHTQPNELELFNSMKDNRLCNTETRVFPSSLDSPSLNIYRDWFKSRSFSKRLYRLSNRYPFSNSLNEVMDIDWTVFDSLTVGSEKDSILGTINKNPTGREERKKQILNVLEKNIKTDLWMNELFPLDYILLKRSSDQSYTELHSKELEEKAKELMDEIADDLQ